MRRRWSSSSSTSRSSRRSRKFTSEHEEWEDLNHEQDDNDDGLHSKLIVEEDRSVGDVPWSTYQIWIRACGGFSIATCVLFVYLCSQVLNIGSTLWLSYWAEQDRENSRSTMMVYFWIFCALHVALTLSFVVRILVLYLAGLKGSHVLFRSCLTRVLRAPMSFFDTTPLGRIVNRFSKDIYAIDETLPANWGMLFGTLFTVISTLATIVYVTPLFSIVLVPLALMYYRAQRYFIKVHRSLYLSFYLSFYHSIYLSIDRSIYRSIYLSIYISMSMYHNRSLDPFLSLDHPTLCKPLFSVCSTHTIFIG
jgi:ABC-type multidrug transport system fused ATPase/permease subunit